MQLYTPSHHISDSPCVVGYFKDIKISDCATLRQIGCMSQAGAAAYAASCAQDFPDASELIEELFERWDRRSDHGDP